MRDATSSFPHLIICRCSKQPVFLGIASSTLSSSVAAISLFVVVVVIVVRICLGLDASGAENECFPCTGVQVNWQKEPEEYGFEEAARRRSLTRHS